MFILAACAGILMLSSNPHGGEHLKDLLVGQILWVNTTQLLWLGGVSAVLLAALAFGWVEPARPLRLLRRVRARRDGVGAAGRRLPRVLEPDHSGARRRARITGGGALGIAYGIGAAGYALGLALSALFDLPSGAVIVWTLAGTARRFRGVYGGRLTPVVGLPFGLLRLLRCSHRVD